MLPLFRGGISGTTAYGKGSQGKVVPALQYDIETSTFILAALKKYPNITVGSHSMSHVMLSKIPENWLKWEINTSLEYINQISNNYKKILFIDGNHEHTENFPNLIDKYEINNMINNFENLLHKLNNSHINIINYQFNDILLSNNEEVFLILCN